MYVAFEGVDTSGKSTQIELLRNIYKEAVFTKEPGGTELGKKLREILLHEHLTSKKAELFLFLADRAEHYEEVILPNRERLIISDRSLISGIAYAEEFSIEQLLEMNMFALAETLPDKIVFLELHEEELKRRIGAKEQDRIEKRGIEYLLRLQMRIGETLEQVESEILRIDASMDILEIHNKIVSFIEE